MNVAEQIFLSSLNTMKTILDTGEFKFGKSSEEFKYFKKQIMDATYRNLHDLLRKLETENMIKKCDCGSNLRHGYGECTICHGAGYCNAK